MNKGDLINKFCCTIGMLPTSYKVSLTYEEQIMAIGNYLDTVVFPAINNNAEALTELQGLFVELKNYVDNYFEDLDVQTEINNKLDDMAESGELEEVIAQYLNDVSIIAFNTVNDMKAGESFIDGSIAKTLGQTTYNDGNGAFYKIRTLTAGDTIDGVNIIALTNFNTLIAELIPYTKMKAVIEAIPTNERNAIYIGNSFINGAGSTSGTDGIYNLTKDLFNNTYKFATGGIGFLTYTDHTDTFLTKFQQSINDTSIDKNSITDIIVVGAWGDTRAYAERGKTDFLSDMQTALTSFKSMVENNYPNASRVSFIWAEGRAVQHPSSTYDTNLSDEFNIHNLFKYLLPRYNIQYLGWIGFNITLNDNYFSNDNIHPNDMGYRVLADSFKCAYCGTLTYKPLLRTFTLSNDITTNSSTYGEATIYPDKWFLKITRMLIKTGSTPAFNTEQTIADFTSLDWCLPLPFDIDYVPFGNSFTVQTQRPRDDGFTPANNYYARLKLEKTATGHSTVLKATCFSNSKTVSTELSNAGYCPDTLFANLEWQ